MMEYGRKLGVGSKWRVNSMENTDEHEMCNEMETPGAVWERRGGRSYRLS